MHHDNFFNCVSISSSYRRSSYRRSSSRRTVANEPVILQQLGTARHIRGLSLRRCCKTLQMPAHRNVLPAHAGTRHVPVVVVHALIREDQTTHCTCHGMIYIEYCLFIIHEIINKQKSNIANIFNLHLFIIFNLLIYFLLL